VGVPRRDWRLIAAGVTVVLLALVVVGRLQSRNLAEGDTGVSRATRATVATDDTPVASGLAVAGRMLLPSSAVAATVGEGALWVLLDQGTLLRVDPDRHQVTGRVELGTTTSWSGPAGALAVGAGAVWVGNLEGTATVRVDPASLRVTARFGGLVWAVAHGVLWSYCCPRGDEAMGFGRVDARTLRPRPPLLVKDAAGRHQPVGWLAVGADAVWTQAPKEQRLWRVPLAGGPARAVRVSGFAYGLAADRGAVWVLSSASGPDVQRDRTGRLRRLEPRTGKLTTTTPLPDLAANQAVGPVLGGGAVWLAGPYSRRLHGGGILLRVDPTSGRVTGWLREPLGFLQDVLAAGPRGAWVATAAPGLLHVVPA
jgi:streptogramin lyase